MDQTAIFAEPTWAIVELMGHNVTAGQITEVNVAGAQMLRVDVPGADGEEPFTKFYGGGAIYGITPTDEASARIAIGQLNPPVNLWVMTPRPQLQGPFRPGDFDE